jgi:LmbE family N-acetylglucosaminyl deacetylase
MTVLFLGAHADDPEISAGATMDKFHRLGYRIVYIAFSWCGKEELMTECKRATTVLGVTDRRILGYQHRNFPAQRQEILQDMIKYRELYKPDKVFTHSPSDVHQDHRTVAEETLRAFKTEEILAYDQVWNNQAQNLSCPSEVTDQNIKNKLEAMSQYESQKNRSYCNPEFIKGLARVRGVQFQVPFAEAFEVLRTRV